MICIFHELERFLAQFSDLSFDQQPPSLLCGSGARYIRTGGASIYWFRETHMEFDIKLIF
jgi:hypothetical protein